MGDKTFRQVLKGFKFSEKETEVYLALLELGPAVVSDIAKKAGINRSTTYVILDLLAKRGLVSTIERRGVKVYNPASAERLIKDLEKTAEQYAKLAGTARELLPKIKERQNEDADVVPKPKVQLFEGAEGMKTVYEDALNSLETIRAYAFGKNANRASLVAPGYIDRLSKKNINVRVIYSDSAGAKELMTQGKKADVPPSDFAPDVSIYNNKIVIMSPEQNIATIIENKELAAALKKAFDLSWKETQRRGKKGFFASAKGIA